jgi:hypothetical protein
MGDIKIEAMRNEENRQTTIKEERSMLPFLQFQFFT